MKCTRCDRTLPPAMGTCIYCGGRAVASAREDAEIDCPGCAQRMGKLELDGVTIDECGGCGGSWYDKGEIELLLARPRADPHLPSGANEVAEGHLRFVLKAEDGYRKCPRCRGVMARRNYERISGVLIDLCPIHGVYLDRAELERLHAFVASGGLEAARRARSADELRAAKSAAVVEKVAERLGPRSSSRSYGARGGGYGFGDLIGDVFGGLFDD